MANYLPVLLVSVSTNAVPDDSAVSTLPRGQVDYLSHDWREEDVWRSWRNMTRQKNEIANGMRLENASWRTWWKQRNKLKTVTPETLNWLKDSDVTWLYGPLHTAVDWAPPPKPPPIPSSVDDPGMGTHTSATHSMDLAASRIGTPSPANSHSDDVHAAGWKKSILKHRSISELLTSELPSPLYSPPESESDDDEGDEDEEEQEEEDDITMDRPSRNVSANAGPPARPSLLHTKSDTHITRWGPSRAFRKDSPPRVHADKDAVDLEPLHNTHSHHHHTPSKKDASPPSNSDSSHSREPRRRGTSELDLERAPSKKRHITFNTFVEQCIAIEKPKTDEPEIGTRGYAALYDGRKARFDDSDGDYTTGVLVPPSTSPMDSESDDDEDDNVLEMRTSSRPRPRRAPPSTASTSSSSGASSRASSRHPQPPIARTPSGEKPHVTIAPIAPTMLKTHVPHAGGERGKPVSLVYVPPSGSSYAQRSSSTSPSNGHRNGDVYHHPRSRGSVDAQAAPPAFFADPVVQSPPEHADEHERDGGDAGAYDYFGGTDLRRMPGRQRSGYRDRERRAADPDVQDDDQDGRGAKVAAPEVVVNGVGGMLEEELDAMAATLKPPSADKAHIPTPAREGRPRSRSRSRSRTPSPVESATTIAAVSIPHSGSTHTPTVTIPRSSSRASTSSSLLSPPERGRSSSSSSLDERGRGRCDERERPRGRSATRSSSSFSRERSGSRGAGSPMGSLSPEGSAVGLAHRYRRRDRDRERERGISESLSPQMREANLGSQTRESNLNSSSHSSRPSPSALHIGAEAALGSSPPSLPTPIPEESEEEQVRSRQPTPSNSPVMGFHSAQQVSMPPASPPVWIKAGPGAEGRTPTVNIPSSGLMKDVGELESPHQGTMVGRAVGMVSSAGAYLGSMWH